MKTASVLDEVWDRIERAARDQQLVSAPVVGVAGGVALRMGDDETGDHRPIVAWELRIEVDTTLPPTLAALVQQSSGRSWGSVVGGLIDAWNAIVEGLVRGVTCELVGIRRLHLPHARPTWLWRRRSQGTHVIRRSTQPRSAEPPERA